MSDSVLNDMLTPEAAVKNDAHCICFVMDEDTIKGLQRLKAILGFPIGAILAVSLRPLIDTFLPLADLYEQGKLTADCLPETVSALESLIIKADVQKARLDKKMKKLEKQQKMKRGVDNERESKGST